MHVEQLLENLRLCAGCFDQPGGCVVDDGAQAVGMGFQLGDKGENPRFTGKVGLDGQCPARAQVLDALAFVAVSAISRWPSSSRRSAQYRPMR